MLHEITPRDAQQAASDPWMQRQVSENDVTPMQGGGGGGGALLGGVLSSRPRLLPKEIAGITVLGLLLALIGYTVHCVWVSAEMYSAPSIVLQTR